MLKKAKTIFMLSFVIGVSENAKYGTSIIQVVVSVHVYEDVSVAVAPLKMTKPYQKFVMKMAMYQKKILSNWHLTTNCLTLAMLCQEEIQSKMFRRKAREAPIIQLVKIFLLER